MKVFFSLSIFLACFLWPGYLVAQDAAEKIVYEVSPLLGVSEYQDMGLVDFHGRRVNLTIFYTNVAGLKDTEKIYSDPKTNLPLWVERDVSLWLRREYLTEEYVSSENRLTITKFVRGKEIAKYSYQGKGPIHNAILLPFVLRKMPELKPGWSCKIRFPNEFTVKFVGIEDVSVPAGKFKAYHITSTPHQFEIWISADKERLPVKIKGIGVFSYTLAMKQRIVGTKEGQAR
ncbi:MAG: hypothetical protein WCI77_02345 [Candidatus Omnitrophota bacterium]